MKTLITSLSVLASLLAVLLLAVAAIAWQGHRRLAEANTTLEKELAEARLALDTATAESQATAHRLTTLESAAAALESRVNELKASAEAAESTLPRAYRVRAFLGKDSLGEAWMIPQNITRDPDSGHYRFEPVLLLNESSRNHFTVHHTNVVETKVLTTDYTPYYYRYPYYNAGWYPSLPGRSNLPPVEPQPPTGMPQPFVAGPGYGDVSASARVFAPPFSRVNTRPQVLGRPATSGANAQVFAP